MIDPHMLVKDVLPVTQVQSFNEELCIRHHQIIITTLSLSLDKIWGENSHDRKGAVSILTGMGQICQLSKLLNGKDPMEKYERVDDFVVGQVENYYMVLKKIDKLMSNIMNIDELLDCGKVAHDLTLMIMTNYSSKKVSEVEITKSKLETQSRRLKKKLDGMGPVRLYDSLVKDIEDLNEFREDYRSYLSDPRDIEGDVSPADLLYEVCVVQNKVKRLLGTYRIVLDFDEQGDMFIDIHYKLICLQMMQWKTIMDTLGKMSEKVPKLIKVYNTIVVQFMISLFVDNTMNALCMNRIIGEVQSNDERKKIFSVNSNLLGIVNVFQGPNHDIAYGFNEDSKVCEVEFPRYYFQNELISDVYERVFQWGVRDIEDLVVDHKSINFQQSYNQSNGLMLYGLYQSSGEISDFSPRILYSTDRGKFGVLALDLSSSGVRVDDHDYNVQGLLSSNMSSPSRVYKRGPWVTL